MATIAELFDLSGKIAVVTGAAQGMGRAIAYRLADAGARVLVAGHNQAGLDETAVAIRSRSGSAVAFAADVTRMSDLDAIVQKAQSDLGGIDILVNCAGGAHPFTPALDVDEELWDKTFHRNLKGGFFLSQKAARSMIAAGRGGRIINIASIASLRPDPLLVDYSSSKAGVTMMTRALAQEFGPHRILVNAILPGPVDTPNSAPFFAMPEVQKIIREKTPLGGLGKPEDVANATLFLASAAASHITGISLVVDGGFTIS